MPVAPRVSVPTPAGWRGGRPLALLVRPARDPLPGALARRRVLPAPSASSPVFHPGSSSPPVAGSLHVFSAFLCVPEVPKIVFLLEPSSEFKTSVFCAPLTPLAEMHIPLPLRARRANDFSALQICFLNSLFRFFLSEWLSLPRH